ncbi:MAG: hypothetical protein K6E75_05035 [Lachnospiraceae bacterium]|nr:hypothetical protein [Lachnospiraceae bacterium]
MQNRQMGKGAERKTFCALFLYENEKTGKMLCREKEISAQDRKSLKDGLRTGEMELLVIGYPGLQQAARLAADRREALRAAIPDWMLDEVIRTDERLQGVFVKLIGETPADISDEMVQTEISDATVQGGISDKAEQADGRQQTDREKCLGILFPIADKGIFAGLWELGEALCCGIDGQILQIPMKQSVIEICNAQRINPYESPSAGSGLFVTGYGRRMEDFFAKKDLPAAVIGRITAGADRVLRMEDQVRYLGSE